MTGDPQPKRIRSQYDDNGTAGALLDSLASDELGVLPNRRIPVTRGDIDHLVITPSAVRVIDPKHYRGRPRLDD